MAQLVFLQRTQKEIEIFGGDVFFDIDGKNVGKLSLTNEVIDLPAGVHIVKMYKSHTFDTYIGFAEQTLTLSNEEKLMVKYSAPMMVNQPGNMVISEYSEQKEIEVIRQREQSIQRDFVAAEEQKRQANENYNNGIKWVVGIAIAISVIFGIYYAVLMSSF